MEYKLEACVESLSQAVAAAQHGADQLEFCADLDQDGLTPEVAPIKALLTRIDIPIKVMIRPRGGSFVFNAIELEEMKASIQAFKSIGINRFVIGMATSTNELDIRAINLICAAFPTSEFTLHKVIDQVRNPIEGIEALNRISNLTSILTSGGAATALQGAAQIKAMQKVLHPSKQIIAAGKITRANLEEVKAQIQVPVYHGRLIVG